MKCDNCKRELTSPVALKRGVGPDCAAILGRPYTPVDLALHTGNVYLSNNTNVTFNADGAAVFPKSENSCQDVISSFKQLEKFGVTAKKDANGNVAIHYDGTEKFDREQVLKLLAESDQGRAKRHANNLEKKIVKYLNQAKTNKAGRNIAHGAMIAATVIAFAAVSVPAGAFSLIMTGLKLFVFKGKKTKNEIQVEYIQAKIKEMREGDFEGPRPGKSIDQKPAKPKLAPKSKYNEANYKSKLFLSINKVTRSLPVS
jgi:hypothetical protein